MKNFVHILIVTFLTILTQVGGMIWLIVFGYFKWTKKKFTKISKLGLFALTYLISTLLIIPPIAKIGGRVPLPILHTQKLIPHNIITPLLNRHYVRPQLKDQLLDIAKISSAQNSNLKVSYLDANFPFIDGFPLLPHISHDDGRKVDLAFYYTKNTIEGNYKPSNSGYGVYVEPHRTDYNQTKECNSRGYWQYDYSKYLTFGSRSDLEFDLKNTKNLINHLVHSPLTQKVLLEPHLKRKMNMSHKKIRFQGCHSVRHDDHVHHQISN